MDWPGLLRWALLHDSLPPLAAHQASAAAIPEKAKYLLQEYCRALEKHRQAVREELCHLWEAWSGADLQILLCPLWADGGYTPGQPVPRWVDIFVLADDLPRFLRTLESQGFERLWPSQINHNFTRSETHLLYRAGAGRAILSVRWRIPGRTGHVDSMQGIWQRRELKSVANLPAFVPAPADHLLLSAMRGSENHWRLLPDILAVCQQARQFPSAQWEPLLRGAAVAACKKNLLLALDLASTLGRVQFPDGVTAEIRAAGTMGTRQLVVSRLFSLEGGAGTLHDLQWDLPLLDSGSARARHVARFLFTPTPADVFPDSLLGALLRPLRLAFSLAGIPLHSAKQKLAPSPSKLSTFLPSESRAIDQMLQMAATGAQDVIYDLGCGDGRILLRAAEKYGAHGVGIDLDPQRVAAARENARSRGLDHLVQFRVGGMMQDEIRDATVVTLYLPAAAHLQVGATLEHRLRKGTRVVSSGSDTGVWDEAQVLERNGYPTVAFLRRIVGQD